VDERKEDRIIVAEAEVINRVLRKRGVHGGVGRLKDMQSKRTLLTRSCFHRAPSFVVYRLRLNSGQKLAKVAEHIEDIESWLQRFRNDNGYNAADPVTGRKRDVSVRLDRRNQALWVSRLRQDVIRYEDVSWTPSLNRALVGCVHNRDGVDVLEWAMDNPSQAHLLLAGATGAGKTVHLVSLLQSMFENMTPDRLQVYFADGKPSTDFALIDRVPHVQGVARDYDKVLGMAEHVQALMQQRYEQAMATGSKNFDDRIVFVVEEIASLYDAESKNGPLQTVVNELARKGREAGINLIVTVQQPNQDVLGGQLKFNLGVRLVGRVMSAAQSNAAVNIAKSGAEKLPGNGAFVGNFGGAELVTYQAPLTQDPNDVWRALAVDTPVDTGRAQPGYGVDTPGYPVGTPVGTTGYGLDISSNIQQNGTETPEIAGFPLGAFRTLRNAERRIVRQMAQMPEYQHNGRPSVRKLSCAVFGSYRSTDRGPEIQAALAGEPAPNSQPKQTPATATSEPRQTQRRPARPMFVAQSVDIPQ